MDALAYLHKATPSKVHPVYLLTGDENFLKRLILERLRPLVIAEADPAFALSAYPGESVEWSAVRTELETMPFVGPRRLVVIDQADGFVTKYRSQLEKYTQKPSPVGVLVLDVKSEKSNTKLAKLLADDAFLVCATPASHKLPEWAIGWAKTRYGKILTKPAAQLLCELVEPQLGLLDKELDKLSTFVGEQNTIDAKQVDQLVGRSRTAQVFSILDRIGQGKADEALGLLRDLLEEGEEPIGILAALGAQLRKLGKAARLVSQGLPLDAALDRAGVPSWPQARDSARKQLHYLGWRRLDKLFDWMLELDAGLKGHNPLPAALQLERFLVRLAKPREN